MQWLRDVYGAATSRRPALAPTMSRAQSGFVLGTPLREEIPRPRNLLVRERHSNSHLLEWLRQGVHDPLPF